MEFVTSSNFYNGKNRKIHGLERKFNVLNFLKVGNVNCTNMKFIKYEHINIHYALKN